MRDSMSKTSPLHWGNIQPPCAGMMWRCCVCQAVEETGACRDYDDFFCRTRYTVPEGVLTEDGRMESFNNDLVIRYLDRVVWLPDFL